MSRGGDVNTLAKLPGETNEAHQLRISRMGANRPSSRDRSPAREINIDLEMTRITEEYELFKKQKAKKLDDAATKQTKYNELIDRLHILFESVRDSPELIEQINNLKSKIDRGFELKSNPFPKLSQAQLTQKEEAEKIIQDWVDAGPGFNYEDLSEEVKTRVNELIPHSNIGTLLETTLRKDYRDFDTPETMLVLLKSIKKLLQMKIAECCINPQGQIGIVIGNRHHIIYLTALAQTCIDRIIQSLTGTFSLLPLALEAASHDPQKAALDVTSISFATAVLANCSPQGLSGFVGELKGIASTVLDFMTKHPAESFVSGSWTFPQLRTLYEAAIRQMYPNIPEPTLRGLVDGMNDDFLTRSRRGITGDAPVAVVTLFEKASYLLHRLMGICVGQCQFTGDMVRSAIALPKFLMDMANYAKLKVSQGNQHAGLFIMKRYGFVPQEVFAGFEDTLMAELNKQQAAGLLDMNAVQLFVTRLLKHNFNSTVWDPSVKYHTAQSDVHRQFPTSVDDDSLHVAPSETPRAPLSPARGDATFGDLPGPGEIQADLTFNPAGDVFPRGMRDMKHYGASLKDQYGGRSRSREHSVSKRTRRRKGVAKKQKSNKNKRQSRRKVRRASSRKGRK